MFFELQSPFVLPNPGNIVRTHIVTYWRGVNEDGPSNARCIRPVFEGHACHNNIWGKVPLITLCPSHFNLIPMQDYHKEAYLGNQYSDVETI